MSFYVLKPNDSKNILQKWSDVFHLASDKKKKVIKSYLRKATDEEREEFEKLTGEKMIVLK